MELTVGGRRVFAGTGGRDLDRKQPLVLLLHGAGMDHTVWVLQARFLAYHGFSVLALDLPGHGRSEGPALPTVEALADWTLATIEAAGFEKAAIVGHSMGAAMAVSVAAKAPGKVSRLALLGAAPAMPVHPDLLASARDGTMLAPELMTFWGLGRSAQIGGHATPGLWLTGAARRLIQKGVGPSLAADLAACGDWKAGAEAAKKIRCPVLVLAGSDDRMTPAAKARELAQAISGAELKIVAGAGHMMILEAPDATVDALQAFLNG